MRTIKRRLLQVSSIVLALTMLSIYVVRSQQSRQRSQIAPSSKMKALSGGVSATPLGTNRPLVSEIMAFSSKSAPVIETKGVATVLSQPAGGTNSKGSNGVISVTPPLEHIKLESPLTPKPPPTSNRNSTVMMPGSKSDGLKLLHIDEHIDEIASSKAVQTNPVTRTVLTTNAPAKPSKQK